MSFPFVAVLNCTSAIYQIINQRASKKDKKNNIYLG